VLVDLVLGPRREPSGEPPRVSVAGA
jgi:hypothetical protein